jgi:threonine dehydrogenase-like Zn-dependent dehydrogenase
MKAAVLYANEDIRYDDYPAPLIKAGCVKVKVKATGICGSDVPRVLANGAHFYPVVLGHEFAARLLKSVKTSPALKTATECLAHPFCLAAGVQTVNRETTLFASITAL